MNLKLNAFKLRKYKGKASSEQSRRIKRNEIYIILDNVLDTYNIGSIFRLADAISAKKIYLCGGTETPPNPRIKKASINTTEFVEWEWCESAVEAIYKLRKLLDSSSPHSKNIVRAKSRTILQIVAIEQNPNSVPFNKFDYKLPIALVVGHESDGVSREVLEMVDGIVELPMFGANISLNVMVSLGIVLYKVIEHTS